MRVLPDGDGWRIEREPEFTDEDRALLRAGWDLEQATSRNGFLYSDEVSPLADRNRPDATHYFEADELPTVNYAERARAKAERAYREAYKAETGEEPDTAGMSWAVHKITLREEE